MRPIRRAKRPSRLRRACGAEGAAVLRPYKWSKAITLKSTGVRKTVTRINHGLRGWQGSGFRGGGSAC